MKGVYRGAMHTIRINLSIFAKGDIGTLLIYYENLRSTRETPPAPGRNERETKPLPSVFDPPTIDSKIPGKVWDYWLGMEVDERAPPESSASLGP